MSLFDHLARDARHALRTISRMPLLAAVVVVSLGVGIGVNVVVFSWLQAVVLQPLPGVANARQLVFVEPRSEAGTYPGVSWQEYEDLRDRLRIVREPDRVPHGAVQRRRAVAQRADLRAAGLGQLFRRRLA